MTFWTWQSWGKLSERSSLILTCAKQVGLANCSCGCENNLLKLCDQIDFDLGGPEDPIYEDLTDEQIQTMVMAMKYEKNPAKKRTKKTTTQ